MKHTKKTVAERMVNWMEENAIFMIRLGFIVTVLELVITKNTPIGGLNLLVLGGAFATVPKIGRVSGFFLSRPWKNSGA